MNEQRPIGWWLKRLDELLDQAVDSAVAGDGLTRRDWQVLHSLGPGGRAEADLQDALGSFGGPADVRSVVEGLAGRGWVTRTGAGRLELTTAGRVAGERLLGRISALRRRVTDGLGAEEYERTVAALARMVGNVERALGEPPAAPGRKG